MPKVLFRPKPMPAPFVPPPTPPVQRGVMMYSSTPILPHEMQLFRFTGLELTPAETIGVYGINKFDSTRTQLMQFTQTPFVLGSIIPNYPVNGIDPDADYYIEGEVGSDVVWNFPIDLTYNPRLDVNQQGLYMNRPGIVFTNQRFEPFEEQMVYFRNLPYVSGVTGARLIATSMNPEDYNIVAVLSTENGQVQATQEIETLIAAIGIIYLWIEYEGYGGDPVRAPLQVINTQP